MAFDLDDEELRETKIMNGTLKEDIQVGEYIRNKEGYIDKVKKIIDDEDLKLPYTYYACNEVMASSYRKEIVKHSFNIIDIIEVGDIVKTYDVLNEDVLHIWSEDILYIWSEDMLKALKEDVKSGLGIKSIVTKEAFAQMEYKVGE